MSNWINWRMAIVRDRELSFGAKGLALYLNTFMNDRQDSAWPGISTICGEMNLSNKTAIKYIKELADRGWLGKQKRFGNSTVYHVLIPRNVESTLMEELHRSSGESTPTVVEDLHTNKQKNKQVNKQDIQTTSVCPQQKLQTMYHEILPMCPKIRTWTTTRERYLRARWKEHPDLEWWKGFLEYASESKFLTGKASGNGDRPPFIADFEWILKPSNFAKINEGKYHR